MWAIILVNSLKDNFHYTVDGLLAITWFSSICLEMKYKEKLKMSVWF